MSESVVIDNIEEVCIRVSMKIELTLDFQSELAGENGEVYLFQWLSSTEKKLRTIQIVRM